MRDRLEHALASALARRLALLFAWALVGVMGTIVVTIAASLAVGQKLVVIGSESQEPSLLNGDVAIERQIHPDQVEAGQIITFSEPGTGHELSHRVKLVRRQGARTALLTRGDSSATYERFTLPDEGKVGVVIRRIPLVGRLADLLGGPLALVLLPLLVLGIAGGIELSRRRLRVET